jgi:hypothetical protein
MWVSRNWENFPKNTVFSFEGSPMENTDMVNWRIERSEIKKDKISNWLVQPK